MFYLSSALVILTVTVVLATLRRFLLRTTGSGIYVIVIRHAAELKLHKAEVASTPVLQRVLKGRCLLMEVPKSEVLSKRDTLVLEEAASHASTVLLFPSSHSSSIEEVVHLEQLALRNESSEAALHTRQRTLVVIDGSWKTATSLVYKNDVLRPTRIPHVHISPKRAGLSAYMRSLLHPCMYTCMHACTDACMHACFQVRAAI